MAKFGREKGENRDQVFTMRFTAEELGTLRAAAEERGRKIPGLIREAPDPWFAKHKRRKEDEK